MVQYFQKFIKNAKNQRHEAFFLWGAMDMNSIDYVLYINVMPDHLEMLKRNDSVRGSFTQLPKAVVAGVSPAYADNSYLVLELQSEDGLLADKLKNELNYEQVDFKTKSL